MKLLRLKLLLKIFSDYYNIKEDGNTDGNRFYTSEQIKVVNIEIIDKQIDKFPPTINKHAQGLENAKTKIQNNI